LLVRRLLYLLLTAGLVVVALVVVPPMIGPTQRVEVVLPDDFCGWFTVFYLPEPLHDLSPTGYAEGRVDVGEVDALIVRDLSPQPSIVVRFFGRESGSGLAHEAEQVGTFSYGPPRIWPDGSQSSDPDGPIVTYVEFAVGGEAACATWPEEFARTRFEALMES
jgi:hypothetical protein